MIEVYLVRHGETEWNRKLLCQGRIDIDLNDNGINQALELGSRFKEGNFTFDRFISSPLLRAKETMGIIKNKLGVSGKTIIDKSFIERDFGELEGKDVNYVREIVESKNTSSLKGFENDLSIGKRVFQEMCKLDSKYTGEKILIVCHSHTIKGLLTYLDPEEYSFSTKLPNMNVSKFTVDNNQVSLDKLYLFS